MDWNRSVGYIARMVSRQKTFHMDETLLPAGLRVGTSSWSTASWRGVFYSDRCRAGNYISEYSRVFDTVEIDSTFYGTPRPGFSSRRRRLGPSRMKPAFPIWIISFVGPNPAQHARDDPLRPESQRSRGALLGFGAGLRRDSGGSCRRHSGSPEKENAVFWTQISVEHCFRLRHLL